MYGIAQWYIRTNHQPYQLGVSFVADYAQFLGVNPHQTFLALLDDLHVRNFRLVSYWSDIEPQPGVYDFDELDWEFQQAAAHHAKIMLTVGLRQPRWPECHAPSWTNNEPISVWQPQLERFMTAVVNRYKNSPALGSYQLENEYFLSSFGLCTDHTLSRLIDEANLVRRLDPYHPLVISRSENALGWPVGPPHADVYAISIYRRVWTPVLGRYIEYPYPAWYYAFLAGAEKIWSGKDTFIHELQAEPWPPSNVPIPNSTLSEQNKSFNATTLINTVNFGQATGMKLAYLWGGEYWYYRMVVLHDPSVWQTAKREFASFP
jgi:hypothetical protein